MRSQAFLTPCLMDIEVASALRRLVLSREIDSYGVQDLLVKLSALPVERVPHTPFLRRIWELRQNFTCYDASYIALAEAAGATLYTLDTKLARGHKARVLVFAE